jgi:hypothetical protein
MAVRVGRGHLQQDSVDADVPARDVLLGPAVVPGDDLHQPFGAELAQGAVCHVGLDVRLPGANPLPRVTERVAAEGREPADGVGGRDELLDQDGRLKMSDMDLIELNEAFAAQVLACTREWGFGAADFERLNVHGSGISLGHPVGATGTRILTTLAREMRRRQARYGLETMCIGGGQGLAAIFETVAG